MKKKLMISDDIYKKVDRDARKMKMTADELAEVILRREIK